MKNAKTNAILLAAAFVLLLLGYQNCGPDMGPGEESSEGAGAPFAYEATFDRIAYLSCANTNTGTTHFTLKAGAYNTDTSGVRLSSAFQRAAANYTASRKIELINQDEHNRDAQLVFGLRPFSDMQAAVTVNGATMVKNVLTPLNQSPLVSALANLSAGEFLPYTQHPAEAALNLNAANDQSFRDSMTQQSNALALTYLEKGQRYASRTIDGKTPGAAYHVMFDCGTTPGNMHVLCAVEDYDLLSGGSGGQWDCPDVYHYKIVRSGEAGAAGCNFSNPQTTNPEYIEVRKILGPNWQIDVSGNCLQPTQGSCYPGTVSSVDYNLGANCDQAGQPACAKHFSLCLKDN